MWIVFALGASIFWGISYVLSEQVYRHISILTSIAFTLTVAGIMVGAIALTTNVLSKDVATMVSSPRVFFLLALGTLALIIAELCIGFSISNKNSTIAGLIEISYPLFIVLFSFLFFRESNLNLATIIGASLVFTGVGLIYAFNR